MNYKLFKRFLDIIFAITLFLLLWPLLLVIAIIIKLDSNGTVVYKQKRYNGVDKTFNIYKFRTMKSGARTKMVKNHKNPKRLITKFGKVLRELHMDELPQLINIIKGDVSFIGVRPQQEKEQIFMLKNQPDWSERFGGSVGVISLERIINICPRMHKNIISSLKNADYLLEKKNRIDYDLYYVKNENFYNDVVLMFYLIGLIFEKTISVFIKREFKEFDNCDQRWKNRQLY